MRSPCLHGTSGAADDQCGCALTECLIAQPQDPTGAPSSARWGCWPMACTMGYLVKLLGNAEVAKFLRGKAPEILEQFESIAETMSLEG